MRSWKKRNGYDQNILYPCLSSLSIAVVKHRNKSSLGRKAWIWLACPIYRPSWIKANAGIQLGPESADKNWSKDHGGTLLTGFLLCLTFNSVSYIARSTTQEWHCQQWAGPSCSEHWARKCSTDLPQASLTEALFLSLNSPFR